MSAQLAIEFVKREDLRSPVPYWPTVSQPLQERVASIRRAERQDEMVLALMRSRAEPMTPWQVHEAGVAQGSGWLIGSVRRSMTNLANVGVLAITDLTRIGPQGAREHFWRLAGGQAACPQREPAPVNVEGA